MHEYTTGYGIENERFLGPKIWRTIPSSLKDSETLIASKEALIAISLIATVDCVKDLLKI